MNEPRRLAAYVQPNLTEARLQAQWSRVAERSAAARWRPVHFYISGFAAAAAVAILLLLRTPGHPGAAPLTVERMASGLQKVTFPEELTVTLQSAASYRVLARSTQAVHLELERGAAEFDVTPGRARRVIVTAAGFDVEVTGTRFEVRLHDAPGRPDVEVRVTHGSVKVHAAGDPKKVIRELTAGESWATRTNAKFDAEPLPSHPEGEAADTAVPASVPASTSTVVTGVGGATQAPTSPTRPLSAKELFEAAEASRLKGSLREAAAGLDRLRRNYPGDPRAGLAAFELGRMRMDQLGDPGGALNALSDALRLDPSARFREDAEARIVQLHHRSKRHESCLAAKAEYLRRYPNGSHAASIKTLCNP